EPPAELGREDETLGCDAAIGEGVEAGGEAVEGRADGELLVAGKFRQRGGGLRRRPGDVEETGQDLRGPRVDAGREHRLLRIARGDLGWRAAGDAEAGGGEHLLDLATDTG